jgi:hypothetical protein
LKSKNSFLRRQMSVFREVFGEYREPTII